MGRSRSQELNTYKNEMWAKFVTGDVGFDQWDTYCEQMEVLGHSRLEAMIKEATGL